MSTYHEGHKIPDLGKVASKGQVGPSVPLGFGVDAVHFLKETLLNFRVERQDDDAVEDCVCGGVVACAESVSRF